MSVWSALRSAWAAMFHRSQNESELEEELRMHLRDRADDLERGGLPRAEAERRARLEFGGYQKFKEECRDATGVHFVETLLQDVKYGLRILRKSPGFTVAAVLTLALGIGANTTIFSVVYGVLLRPLPYRNSGNLVVMNETTPKVGLVSVSYPDFADWKAQSRSFSQMASADEVAFNLAGVSQPENITGLAVSTNFLSMLGVKPILGRDFDASEEKAGTAPAVLLSYALGQSHLGADPNAVGRAITLDGHSVTIVGVLPPTFRWLANVDVMEPIGVYATGNSEMSERGSRGDAIAVARLAPGVSLTQARAEMEGIAARLANEYPVTNDGFGVALQPIRAAYVSDIEPAMLVLSGAVLFVLLIACANVANLFLVRAAGRGKEMALRLAFGASRGRLIRQMLTEGLVLAGFGCICGLALAWSGIRAVTHLVSAGMMSGAAVALDAPVILFAAAVAVVSALLFALAPAAQSLRTDIDSQLKEGARTAGTTSGKNRMHSVLAVAEISLALVLLAGAGLMMKSLHRLLSVNPGFQPERVLTMRMDLRTDQYDKDPAVLNFWQQVLDRVRALPGVDAAALGTAVPLTFSHSRIDITIEGVVLPKPGNLPHPDVHNVSPGYLETLGVPLVRGRAFTDADGPSAPHVALVNAMLARQFFPNGDAVGKRFMFGRPDTEKTPVWYVIAGVVADTKLYGLANPARLEVYVSSLQSPPRHMNLLVRSRREPAALTSAIRGAVASIDKDQPIFGISTMEQLVSDSVSTRRLTLVLLGLFSALALILAAIGIYGVVSYSVAQRTREFGVRLALGAQHVDVLRMVLGRGAKIATLGISCGLAASLALTRLMAKLLFEVNAKDPVTFGAVAAVLGGVALLACYIPARRAMRVDPMVALRYE